MTRAKNPRKGSRGGSRAIHAAELGRWLEKAPAPRFALVIGDEGVLRDRAVAELIERYVDPGLADFNVDRFAGDSIDFDRVLAASATLPMMAERRLVLVRNFQALHHSRRRSLLKGLANAAPSTLVVLESVALTDKESELARALPSLLTVTAKRPQINDALRAVDSEATRHGREISAGAAEALLAARGNDLTALTLEVEKLALYVGERARIEESDVLQVVPVARGPTIFDLADTLALAQLDRALMILDRLFAAGEEAPAVVAVAARHFVILWRALDLSSADRRSAASILKVPSFFVDRYLRQAQSFDHGRLHRIMRELLAADLELKSAGGGIQARRSRVRELVMRICGSAGRRPERRRAGGRA